MLPGSDSYGVWWAYLGFYIVWIVCLCALVGWYTVGFRCIDFVYGVIVYDCIVVMSYIITCELLYFVR